MTKKMTMGEKIANGDYCRRQIEEMAVEELDYDSGRWGDIAYVFEDGSGVYEKRRNDFYPLSAEDIAAIREEEGNEIK